MAILVTGSAGFIGSATTLKLLQDGQQVVGVDNHNDYYDPQLKEARLNRAIERDGYEHFRINICDKNDVDQLFDSFDIKTVIHLAAQAGVRYSLSHPEAYIESNVVGFSNILEICRNRGVGHLVYASSSSVYGLNKNLPFSEGQDVSHPLSLYAATKGANELMAHAYSHLYGLPTTGLRFFTVYGPWGRPDMALFKFTKAILAGDRVQLFNNGQHTRDFTYIDDVVDSIVKVASRIPTFDANWAESSSDPGTSSSPWRILNIAGENPVSLIDYVKEIERVLNKKADIEYLPMQPGDVSETHADSSRLIGLVGRKPATRIEVGVANFVEWYVQFYCSGD